MAESPREDWRVCYHRSWGSTLVNQPFDVDVFREKVTMMLAGTRAEQNIAFGVAHQWMTYFNQTANSQSALDVGITWLREHANPNVSSEAKHTIVMTFYYLMLRPQKSMAEMNVPNLVEIMQQIQPIPLENKGTWEHVKLFSVQCIGYVSPEKWVSYWECLAEQNPTEFLTQEFRYNARVSFWESIKRTNNSSEVVTRLLFHSGSLMRRYGCEFLAKGEVVCLDKDFILSLSDKFLLMGFLSMGLNSYNEKTLRLFLLSIVPRLVRIRDSEIKTRALREMILWLINYPGALLNDEMKTACSQHSVLVDAIKQAEDYFDALKKWRLSPINVFRRYELDRSAILAKRKSEDRMRKEVEKNSIISFLTNGPVSVLYGDRLATSHAGKVSESAPFQRCSSCFELPRLPLIDPDGDFFRRSNTRHDIEELEQ